MRDFTKNGYLRRAIAANKHAASFELDRQTVTPNLRPLLNHVLAITYPSSPLSTSPSTPQTNI